MVGIGWRLTAFSEDRSIQILYFLLTSRTSARQIFADAPDSRIAARRLAAGSRESTSDRCLSVGLDRGIWLNLRAGFEHSPIIGCFMVKTRIML